MRGSRERERERERERGIKKKGSRFGRRRRGEGERASELSKKKNSIVEQAAAHHAETPTFDPQLLRAHVEERSSMP